VNKTKCLVLIASLILFATGCNNKNAEGQIVKIAPMKLRPGVDTRYSIEITDVDFDGDTIAVKLGNGKLVDAIATKEQLWDAFVNDKNKASIEKSQGKWRVIKME
jgi:hypothetical protein